ncbi:MAG: YkgJ family cysteine cluster protein [Thermoproteota archaeon]
MRKRLDISFPDTEFRCIRCGGCCRNTDRAKRRIVLTDNDVERISSATKLRIEYFVDENIDEKYPYVMKLVSGKCFFLDSHNECLIYPYRPLVCRFYPFLMRKIGNRYFFEADPSCPGLGDGKKLNEEYFLGLIEEAEKNLRKL